MIKCNDIKYRLLFLCSFIILISVILLIQDKAIGKGAETEKRVLFISSYDYEFFTVPDQIEGLQNEFQGHNISVDYEFMDMKQYDTMENRQLFYQLLKYKLSNTGRYDAIVVGDDSALQFAMDYQQDLFSQIPVVFLGINDFERAGLAAKNPYMTGIIEETSVEDNIKIAKKFNPDATKVVAIVDDTYTGKGDKARFYKASQVFPELEFSDINTSQYTFDQMKDMLEKFDNDTILIYTNMFMDKTGAYLSISDSMRLIREHTHIPVYRVSGGGMGLGIIGGKMVSYVESGKIAANMVLKILAGTPVDQIPMITESPNQYIFDYKIIQKYNISEKLIPKEAILINKKISFVQQYKELVIVTLIIFAFLSIITILLMINNIKRRIIEKELKESYSTLEETYEELTASEEELRIQYETIEDHVKKIEELNEKFEHLAHHDYLTNLPNRFKFMNHLNEVLSQNRPGAIMLLDIDNFKEVNDTLGHLYGDELLKEFAARLNKLADDKFFASRFGGDEFMVLLSDITEVSHVEEYIQSIEEILLDSFVLENRENHVEYSMGITRFPYDGNNANQLLMYADTALYQVKQNGKNNCLFYENAMQEQLKDKTEIETILRQAIKTEGFQLVYQPQVSVETGEITGFEALIRLKDYNISPAKFIAIAEETGLITKIGRWVTNEVVNQLAKWQEKGLKLKPVAINFSSKQIRDKGYFDFLKDLLRDKNIRTDLIEIEITEGVLLENSEETTEFLNKLKELGIKIALDDFGTGYSSLNYLAYIPVDTVKLDKSLSDKFLNLDNAMVISSIISLAHSLNLDIIAEGIETIEQFKLLKLEGCDLIQGYLFSKPLAIEDVEKIYSVNLIKKIMQENNYIMKE